MSKWTNLMGLRPVLAGVMLVFPMLTACAKTELSANGRVPVAVHGVNYTAQEFGYVLVDLVDKENGVGEETITAYGAGGTVCCFSLPKQWHLGLKAELRATVWLPPTLEDNLPAAKRSYFLDIPAYEQGKAAELWVVRTADDEFSLIASNFQPDHPKWPGKIKGWPVPSVEYQRIIHARFLKEAQSDVKLFESSLADLKNQPVEHGKGMWSDRMISEAKALKAYKGPEDPAFLTSLREEYQTGLVEARGKLKSVKAAQP